MAVSTKIYGKFFLSAFTKKIDSGDTFKAMLCTSSYTPDQDAHQFKSDVTNEVAATGGYSAGGVALTSFAITYDGATNTIKIDADDATWATLTTTARYLVIYDSTPATDATRPLVAYVDFGADASPSAGPLTIGFNAAGIATVTVA